jgi:hypothetical protein
MTVIEEKKDEINNPYSKKSIDFVYVDLLRSIDSDFLKKRSHSSFVQILLFIIRLTINIM